MALRERKKERRRGGKARDREGDRGGRKGGRCGEGEEERKEGKKTKDINDSNVLADGVSKWPLWVDAKVEKGSFKERVS